MHFLTSALEFPPTTAANNHGLLAIGGDLSPERLQLAYQSGIFPWFNPDEPILWWSPPQRAVIFRNEIKVSKSMRNVFNRQMFTITYNRAFEAVIENCAAIPREGQVDTWITPEMKHAYMHLHELGVALSVEVWQDNNLVGGLYGIVQKRVFCGESMFSKVSNASKAALIQLISDFSQFELIDCQIMNPHLESLGARLIPRKEFETFLR
ncbi:leucyl/phenylalanyl-tRNA--protein transferase [Flavobacterium sp.]|uniref:leucyl/phenylalanyl-tRNA--protein transferase n=1 Tax=Flavobacterium sp. TaxID=239 RepID=UPI003B9AFD14